MHSSPDHFVRRPSCPDTLEERLDRPFILSASSSSSSVYLGAGSVSEEDMGHDSPGGLDGTLAPFPSTSQSHIHSRSLKKSASADSQATSDSQSASTTLNGRQSTPATVHHQMVNQLPSLDNSDPHHLSSPPSTMSLSERLLSKVGKRRGTVSAYSTDAEGTTPEDSDATHSGGASSSTVKSLRKRLKSFRSSGLSAEAREASHVTSLNTSVSLSNLRLASPTSPRLSPRPIDAPRLDARTSRETKRLRSQSVGPPSRATTRIVKRLSSGFQLHRPEASREVVIAVIGSAKCGKSVFIHKGLKGKAVTNSERLSASVEIGNRRMEVHYYRREAQLSNDFNMSTRLVVKEYDSQYWRIGDPAELHTGWPEGLQRPDGVFVCYDGSDRSSFQDVVQLLADFKTSGIPSIAVACKCDLEKRISPEKVATAIEPYGCKVIEVSQNLDDGKKRMRRAFDVLVQQAIAIPPAHSITSHAKVSHDLSRQPERSRSQTLSVRTDHAPMPAIKKPPSPLRQSMRRSPTPPEQSNPSTTPPTSPTSPSLQSPLRARSMNDIIAEHSKSLTSIPYESDRESRRLSPLASLAKPSPVSSEAISISSPVAPSSDALEPPAAPPPPEEPPRESTSSSKTEKQKTVVTRVPTSPWASLEHLLEAVMFLAVSGDDPSFMSNFLLTYRRFMTPRSLLLGMQKRMNELNQTAGDVTLTAFAQMRICNLLSQWIAEYPHDFVVPGTSGAFHAFIRNVLSHSHTLSSYGSDFLAFSDTLQSLNDDDEGWAYKADSVSVSETDTENDSIFDPDTENVDVDTDAESPASSHSFSHSRTTTSDRTGTTRSSARSRRASLPLGAISFFRSHTTGSPRFIHNETSSKSSAKDLLACLHRTATNLALYDSDAIAQEITRRDMELFLKIKRRNWLRHTFSRGKKDPDLDPIARFNSNYNHLHEWAVSMILCHDKPKGRAKQIEKLAEVASRLRMLNNYSSLRAIITAINQSTFPGDTVMETFRLKTDLYKKFLSSDVLLRTTGAHQSYRMALRNSKGACIPSLEVHLSDLRRADEGNADNKSDQPALVNWAKYNMIGQFITHLTAIQEQCTANDGYKLTENTYIANMLDGPVMDYEMQQSRITPPADDIIPSHPSTLNLPHSNHKEGGMLRRLLQW